MKQKILLTAVFFSGIVTTTASYSQSDVKVIAANPEAGETIGVIYGISDNGKYAVGSDDLIGNGGFYLDVEAEQFVFFGDAETSANYFAYDVSDNGIVVGASINPDAENEYGEKIDAMTPAYYKDGEWVSLPLKVCMEGGTEVNGCANAISPDGRIIAGYIKRSKTDGFEPALWIDGELHTYEDLNIMGMGTIISHMSADGTVLSGFAEWESGARSAAIWYDGAETRLSTLEDPLENGSEWVDSEGWMSVSPNGKYMAGYCAESTSGVGLKAIYGEVEKGLEGLQETTDAIFSYVDNEGTCYGTTGIQGTAVVMKNGEITSLEEAYGITSAGVAFQTVMAASKTGKVIGGGTLIEMYEGVINAPFVIIAGEEDENLSVEDTTEANAGVTFSGGVLYLSGEYSKADIYSMSGSIVATTSSPITDLSSLQAGVYVVKITAGNGIKTVKIAKN